MRNTFCGTVDYMSPEIIECKQYYFSVDMWTIGIFCYEMVTGKVPFSGNSQD